MPTPADRPATFATDRRIHMALEVSDLGPAIDFYRVLFRQAPTKVRPGYAKFEVAEPPVNLALNQRRTASGAPPSTGGVAHFGIQVKSVAAVTEARRAFESAGLAVRVEEQVACCFAVQTKVWVRDPDGNPWEVYVVLDSESDVYESAPAACCAAAQSRDASPAACCEGAAP